MSNPTFPGFKPFELSDKAEVEAITHQFPPYSDFDFASLWAWDVRNEMAWAVFDDALVIRFADYITGAPFLTFIGGRDPNAVAESVLGLSVKNGWGGTLKLVPSCCAALLDRGRFKVEASTDHRDYLYDLEKHRDLSGERLKGQRNRANKFARSYPHHLARWLDIEDEADRANLMSLWDRWAENRGTDIPGEAAAFGRLLEARASFDLRVVGLLVYESVVAFNLVVLMPSGYCNSLYSKADKTFVGSNAMLTRESARLLLGIGCLIENWQQDLGLPGLRAAKRHFAPDGYLVKCNVSYG